MPRRPSDGGLRPLIRRALPGVMWTTIESGNLAPGTPDLHGLYRGVDFFVECKWTAGWAVTLRPEQVGWLSRRGRAGGRAWVLVRRAVDAGPRRAAADELWLLPGADAVALKARGLRGYNGVVGRWPGGPARWPLDEALRLMTT